jgi:oligopeptide/dipeptide ABC transporter ATP-binding protein
MTAIVPEKADVESSDENVILRLDDIHKTFITRSRGRKVQTFAVRGVSLNIHEGEALGVVGESGCGKSTLARMIAGLDDPTRGVMSFRKLPLKFTHALRKKISIVFQDPYASLNPRMSTASIIREPMHLLSDTELKARLDAYGEDESDSERLERPWWKKVFLKFETKRKFDEKTYVSRLLEQVQLRHEWALRYPHEFSGGQRQRIGIARALATSPELLILDEPVSALDVSVQAGIIKLLQGLRSESNVAMMFISHDLRVVRHLCDRVVVMYLGQIMEDAPSDLLFSHPRHPYTRALIGSIPTKVGEGAKGENLQPDEVKQEIEEKTGHKRYLPFSVIQGELPSPTNPPQGCPFRTRCERATEQCKQKPPLAKMTDGRLISCHFPY